MEDVKIQVVQASHVVVNDKVYYKDSKVYTLSHSIAILYKKLKEGIK